MVRRPVDADSLGHQLPVRALEILEALDLPGDVEEAHLPGLLWPGGRPDLPHAEVVGVLVAGHGEAHHASGEPAGHPEPENAAIERLGAL